MENIFFSIEHMDLLGQGVSKKDKIAFIENTLPGETGKAEIYRKAKGVLFGRLTNPENLDSVSPYRKEPQCPHFNNCRGCQYLHTEYQKELDFKKTSLEQIFAKLVQDNIKIKIHPAKQRFNYRNRMQLHYNLESEELGLVSSFYNKFINASQCLLPMFQVGKIIKGLYKNNNWINFLKKEGITGAGYIEVYMKPGNSSPDITINKTYAEGGFTQINNEMGAVLRKLVTDSYLKHITTSSHPLVLDLFGGNGNLSASLRNAIIKVYDLYPDRQGSEQIQKHHATAEDTDFRRISAGDSGAVKEFLNIDLYRKNPVKQIAASLISLKMKKPDLIILDPPRAGVKFIESYTEELDSPFIFYISCDPATLKRDTLKIIKTYCILEIHLIDLFPGTRHFETFVIFHKKEQK